MMAVEMKMKKKRILAFTACLLAAMLCACSREPAGQTLTGQTPAGTEEAAPQESAAGHAETASAQPEATAENTETASAQPETAAGNAETASPEPEAAVSSEAAESAGTAEPETEAESTETVSPEPETETLTVSVLEGTLNGWADNHTVEIMVDGAPAAFQVEDEDVKAALEAVGEEASFFFEVQQDGEVRRIVGVMLE